MNEYEIGKNYDIDVYGEIAGVKTSVKVNAKCRKITYEFIQISDKHVADWHILITFMIRMLIQLHHSMALNH